MNKEMIEQYVAILNEELVPAFGCTEPIAIAYAAAKAREVLGEFPEKIVAECSGNIVKNVKGVVVPKTNGLRGICVAAILGAVGGDASRNLEVLSAVTPADIARTSELLKTGMCEEKLLQTPAKLYIIVTAVAGAHSVTVKLIHSHANIVHIEKDGEVLLDIPFDESEVSGTEADRSFLSVAGIFEFAETVDVGLVGEILERQIDYNTAISREGLRGGYGAGVGVSLLRDYGADVKVRAKAAAAAGSDARMSGCELPVVINSGSGNQGMTVSLPVIEYAAELGVSREKLYRALCISNFIAVHQKAKIGKLSAYCGAVSAAAGAGAAITYLQGGGLGEICATIVNTIGNVSGIVCDGAKPSCAAKIASSVDAAIMGSIMALKGLGFQSGEGIVKNDIEATIDSVSSLAKNGMRETDAEILRIMVS